SGAAQWLGSWRDGNTGEERRRDLDTGGLELRLRAAPLCARAVAVGYNMIDGMITATAVVATMPLIHNNASDFESFRSCHLDAHPNGSPMWVRWSCPGVQRWHEAGQPRAAFSRATDAVNLQNGSSSVVTLITSIRCHPETRH